MLVAFDIVQDEDDAVFRWQALNGPFQVHAIDDAGEVVVRKALRRAQVLPFFAKLPPCLVGMEACGTSHHWARELMKLGHEVKLMPPAYVKPYVKRGKTDANDAEAICEAVTRPTMRFVPVKSPDQQAALALHRTRSLLVKLPQMGTVLVSGDLMHFRENYETNGVPAFNTDRAQTLASLERVKKIVAGAKATVILQHDPSDLDKLPAFPACAK